MRQHRFFVELIEPFRCNFTGSKKLGGLEAWKLGDLEGWRLGGLEAWKLGGLEGWRLGGLEAWRLGGLEGAWRPWVFVGKLLGVLLGSSWGPLGVLLGVLLLSGGLGVCPN